MWRKEEGGLTIFPARRIPGREAAYCKPMPEIDKIHPARNPERRPVLSENHPHIRLPDLD